MWKCQHCNQEFNFERSSEKANHSRWCDKNPKKEFYKNGLSNSVEAMNKSRIKNGYHNQFSKAQKLGLPPPISPLIGTTHIGTPHTEESKRKISEGRKLYLKNNPDKHPWKRHNKFKSVPCEQFKQKLKDNNISFVEEYQPLLPDRFYSIDIAFPDKKIGIEINGNQHYNNDKTLKKYYQKKHDIMTNSGWQIFEYHYSVVYDEKTSNDIINKLKSDFNLNAVDYSFYIIPEELKYIKCKECSKEILKDRNKSNLCKECYLKTLAGKPKLEKRKFNVTKEELEKLINEKSFVQIGKMFNVSDNSIRKRCKLLRIEIPKREPGYWNKMYAIDNS